MWIRLFKKRVFKIFIYRPSASAKESPKIYCPNFQGITHHSFITLKSYLAQCVNVNTVLSVKWYRYIYIYIYNLSVSLCLKYIYI